MVPTVSILPPPPKPLGPPNNVPGMPVTGLTSDVSSTVLTITQVHVPNFSFHPATTGISASDLGQIPNPSPAPGGGGGDVSDPRLPGIFDTVTHYWGRTPEDIREHNAKGTFVVFVASYADGDWACNTQLDQDGNIVAGSIPDLMAKIKEWSRGEIKGEVVPKPLNIGGPDLMEKRPPFIFFTGHKDFKLTDQEIHNLRDYLEVGGAIWGDNALAGAGSRFDVAFKREMKRVVPDKDKNFVPYSLSDDIFNSGPHPVTEVPPGMNYYAELPEHLDIRGELAILYTPNDYSDIMFMRILPGDKEQQLPYRNMPPKTLYTDTDFWYRQHIFYRNFNLPNSLAVHRLGMSIITYFLIRFDDKLLLTP